MGELWGPRSSEQGHGWSRNMCLRPGWAQHGWAGGCRCCSSSGTSSTVRQQSRTSSCCLTWGQWESAAVLEEAMPRRRALQTGFTALTVPLWEPPQPQVCPYLSVVHSTQEPPPAAGAWQRSQHVVLHSGASGEEGSGPGLSVSLLEGIRKGEKWRSVIITWRKEVLHAMLLLTFQVVAVIFISPVWSGVD